MLISLNTFDTKDLIVLIIAILIVIILIALCNFRLLKKHITHALYYHNYNKTLMKYEKKLKKLFGNRKPEALGNEAVSYHEIINQISHY